MSGNGTMMQYFEWYLPSGMLWKQLEKEAPEPASAGITGVWIPPCCKGNSGAEDVGYAVCDLYDLGEFNHKGSVPTKYGTLKELLAAIRACHGSGLQVCADIVPDHRMGGDEAEETMAKEYKPGNREEQLGERSRKIEAYTHFMFPGRNKNIPISNGFPPAPPALEIYPVEERINLYSCTIEEVQNNESV